MSTISFGIFLPFYALQKSKLGKKDYFNTYKKIVLESEGLGYDSVWLDDHLMYENNPILECWTNLAALASVTTRIRMGTMVTCAAFRNPALLAKMASTLDHISDGRLEFGIGAGVQQKEHSAYGYKFLEPKERIQRLNETVEIIKMLLTQKETTYSGKFCEIKNATCNPKPIQKPHPPITIGGAGEKYALRVTAQHADYADFGFQTVEQFKQKLSALKRHCENINRNFCEIKSSFWPSGQIILAEDKKELEQRVSKIKPKNVSMKDFEAYSLVGTPDQCIEKLKPLLNLGVNRFMLFFADLQDIIGLRLFANQVIPSLMDLTD